MRATIPLAEGLVSSGQQPLPPASQKRTGWLTAFVVTGISLVASALHAAVPIGVIQTFNTAPAVTDWSTKNIAGAGNSIATAANMDIAMQTNTAASINSVVITNTAAAPGNNALAQWSSAPTGLYLVTRPTGNSYTILMATIQNTTANALTAPGIAYDFSIPSALAGEDAELAGHRAYYSLTGLESSWVQIPELTTSTVGSKLAILSLAPGAFPPGGTLYLALVDDNGGPGTDGSFAIDNFQVVTSVAAPVITRQPVGTNVSVGRTINLSVAATGLGLTYAWFKDGVQIDTTLHPSAATANLILTNAQFGDAGQYRVAVANPANTVLSSQVNVTVSDDTTPPKLLRLVRTGVNGSGNQIFRLSVDEPLCEGGACPDNRDALFQFNWIMQPTDDLLSTFVPTAVTPVNGTNYDFEIAMPFDNAKRYRLGPDPGGSGIADLFNNPIPANTYVTNTPVFSFQQGVDGYTGVEDTELEQGTENGGPDAIHGNIARILVDTDNAGGASHGLLKFNNIIGSAAGQIPVGSRIVSAVLTMQHTSANANGNLVNVHRMASTWSQATATWNSFVNGVQADGVEALTTPDFSFDSVNQVVPFTLDFDCTVSVQAWADGFPNNGWALLPTGGDGYRFDSSILTTGPKLAIIYETVPCPTSAPVVTAQPQPKTGVEGSPITLSATVSNACGSTFQWQKNGVDINTAAARIGENYTISNPSPNDNGQYRLVITKTQGGAQTISSAAALTITADPVRPVVLRVGNSNATTLVVTYSKVMGPTASVPGNYTLNGVAASAAVLSADGKSVTLTTAARTFPTAYTLRIAGVKDNRALPNAIDPDPTLVAITTVNVVSAWGGAWQYNTNNQDAAPNWKSVPTASLDGTWQTGNELFGTETSAGIVALFPTAIGTPLPPNTNTPPDMVTFYFRRDVTLPALPAGTTYAINHFIDDGAVFYLDGVEINRFNMPASGAVAYATRATTAGEAAFSSFSFTATAGSHVLAAEVHQGGTTTSSDMLFGAQILAVPTASPRLTITQSGTNAVVHWAADTKWELQNAATSVAGPYGTVALPAANALGTYQTPATGTNQYFRLHFIGP